MSATREAPRRAPDPAADEACAHCGSSLAPDQEWCLECGAARTLVHSPPDPRIAAGIVAAVVLAALVALAIVLINLSTGANRELAVTPPAAPTTTAASSAAAAATTSLTTASTSAATSTTATKSAAAASSQAGTAITLASWPVGLSGWTVILGRSASQASADALAEQLAANGLSVGVLDSNQHPRLPPGLFIVFSGRYPTQPEAAAAAAALRSRGQPQALARQVAPPGGI